MDQISITITASSWPEFTAKVCELATELTAFAQPVQQPTAAPVQQYTQPATSAAPPVAPMQPAPTTAPAYTLEQLALAATPLVDTGRQAELQQLLASFGVQAVTHLPKEQYGAFATALRSMGVKI